MLVKMALLPVWGPVKGLIYITERILEMAEKELGDPAEIKACLLKLQEELEAGLITEEEYLREEEALLARLELLESRDGEELNKEGE